MKKILLLTFVVLGLVSAHAANPMTLESGSLAELTNANNRVLFKIDYSSVCVHNDGNDYTLSGYLEHRGPDFVADWEKDQNTAYCNLPARFNSKNKKGAQAIIVEGQEEHHIIGTVYLSDIDFGNGAGTFNPFGGAKAGGCIISGKLVFTDKAGTELAVLPFTEVKGMGHMSETIRLGLSFFELGNKLTDIIKKEGKK